MIRSLTRLYLYVLIGVATSIFLVNYLFMHVFYDRLQKQAIDSLAAYTFLLKEYLNQYSDIEQVIALKKLQKRSSDEFEIVTEKDIVNVDSEKLNYLRDGKVLLSPDDYYLQLNNGLVIHVRPHEELNFGPQLLAFGVIALLLLLPVLLWIYLHWRDLHKLELAAHEFGAGHLATRVQLSKESNIFQLAQQFNEMANKIETMISHQRDMMRGISHELKTPLARLEFNIALMQSSESVMQQKIRQNALLKDVRELDDLISELLTLSRLEQSNMHLELLLVSIPEFLDSIVATVESEVSDRKLNLNLMNIDTSLHYVCDPKLLARALLNLVRNSIRYANKTISLQVCVTTFDTIVFIVEDDGPGIPVKDRPFIFEPFYRLDHGPSRHAGGFGLGLAIVHNIVQIHGGKVLLEDASSGGARFVITLPVSGSTRNCCQNRLSDNNFFSPK